MDQQKLLTADYLDILYDGRNKRYGSYELRRSYAARARKATALVLMGASLAVIIPGIAAALSSDASRVPPPIEISVTLRKLPEDAPPKDLPAPIPEPPAQVATVENPVLRIVEDEQVTEPPKSMEDIRDLVIGLRDEPGLPGDHTLEPGKGDGDGPLVDPPATSAPKVHIVVEQMPAFDGDIATYLRDHLQYPEAARMAGDEGRVGVRFVVNEDGSISEVELIRGANSALNAEALRVVSAMPRWKPGKQGGIPVKVYFTLPITFRLD